MCYGSNREMARDGRKWWSEIYTGYFQIRTDKTLSSSQGQFRLLMWWPSIRWITQKQISAPLRSTKYVENRRINSTVSVEHRRYNNASYNNLEEKGQDLTEPESKAADKTAVLSQTKENPTPESGQTQKSAHKCHS